MKQNILVIGLTLVSLVSLSGVSSDGRIRADSKSAQNDAKKTEPSMQGDEKKVYDIYGERLRANEKYIAQQTLTDGRIIAYRKNKREIAALVKALKEAGVTDKKLLDPKAWSMMICEKTVSSGCNGGCGYGKACRGSYYGIEKANTQVKPKFDFCICIIP
jgi:hypothetical protein